MAVLIKSVREKPYNYSVILNHNYELSIEGSNLYVDVEYFLFKDDDDNLKLHHNNTEIKKINGKIVNETTLNEYINQHKKNKVNILSEIDDYFVSNLKKFKTDQIKDFARKHNIQL